MFYVLKKLDIVLNLEYAFLRRVESHGIREYGLRCIYGCIFLFVGLTREF